MRIAFALDSCTTVKSSLSIRSVYWMKNNIKYATHGVLVTLYFFNFFVSSVEDNSRWNTCLRGWEVNMGFVGTRS